MTPLNLAQSPSVVEVLVRSGADLEARCTGGATPLIVQAGEQLDSGSLQTMRALIRAGANVQARDDRGQTALDIATRRAEPKKIALLKAALSDD
jgi:ankyrin repeat protein